jgi:hypothetical protein
MLYFTNRGKDNSFPCFFKGGRFQCGVEARCTRLQHEKGEICLNRVFLKRFFVFFFILAILALLCLLTFMTRTVHCTVVDPQSSYYEELQTQFQNSTSATEAAAEQFECLQIDCTYLFLFKKSYYILPYAVFETDAVPAAGEISWTSTINFLCMDEQFSPCRAPSMLFAEVSVTLTPGTNTAFFSSASYSSHDDLIDQIKSMGTQREVISSPWSIRRTNSFDVQFLVATRDSTKEEDPSASATADWALQLSSLFQKNLYSGSVQISENYRSSVHSE